MAVFTQEQLDKLRTSPLFDPEPTQPPTVALDLTDLSTIACFLRRLNALENDLIDARRRIAELEQRLEPDGR